MSADTIISVERLSKCYFVGHQSAKRERYSALRDVIGREARNMARRTLDLFRGRQMIEGDNVDEFWALKDVSFEVRRGEVLGIIGCNGAGKSTLLKILSRITEPTAGRAVLRGRVTSLLEVGTGFHPELTGRENIFLNGAVLGMSRAEVRRKFDEIVPFADVERFLDTPVKRYSSGMYVRLAFAVAAHLETEILVIDEVLAVGDAEFQRRCLGKMKEVAGGGRTVLFVSHNLGAVKTLCRRGILLREGTLAADMSADAAIAEYLNGDKSSQGNGGRWTWNANSQPGFDEIELLTLELRGARSGVSSQIDPDEDLTLTFRYRQKKNLSGERFVLQFVTSSGEIAFTSTDHSIRNGRRRSPGVYASICTIPGGLLNTGTYFLRFWAGIPTSHYLVRPLDIGPITVVGVGNQGTIYDDTWPGAVCPKLGWRVEVVEERETAHFYTKADSDHIEA